MPNDITPPTKPNTGESQTDNTSTPQEIETINETDLEAKQTTAATKPTKTHWWTKLHTKWQSMSGRKKAAWISGGVIILAITAFGIFLLLNKSPNSVLGGAIKPLGSAKPATVASPLSGIQVSPASAKRPVTAIMIENSTDARPQSGLQEAGVVFEAIAEGGITRFMALFQDTSPQYIGPVRSLRPYYIDFAAPFQASIVHVGGSPEALATVRNGSYRDLDQFFNADYFTRVSSRAAPHNVYTSFGELDKLNASKGYTTSQFTPFPRKADAKLATPTAKTIDLAISSSLFYVHYDYDAATNSYARSEGGAPHMELTSSSDTAGTQLKPKVVIALVMPYSIESDGQHSAYGDSGSGIAYVFQDGGVTQGTWTKQDSASQFQFTDANGHALKLNAGQTWVTLLSDQSQVTYSP